MKCFTKRRFKSYGNKKNKVKFGLTNVHYAKIKDWVTDASGANLTPVYVDPVRLPGAVSISIDANGENEILCR